MARLHMTLAVDGTLNTNTYTYTGKLCKYYEHVNPECDKITDLPNMTQNVEGDVNP